MEKTKKKENKTNKRKNNNKIENKSSERSGKGSGCFNDGGKYSIQCNAKKYDTIQYNAIQKSTM